MRKINITLNQTYKEWSNYYFSADCHNSIRSRLNHALLSLSFVKDIEINSISDSLVEEIIVSYPCRADAELLKILWVSLKCWNANDKITKYTQRVFQESRPPHIEYPVDRHINEHPDQTVTFDELYALWRERALAAGKHSTIPKYDCTWKILYPLHNQPFYLLRPDDVIPLEVGLSANSISWMFGLLASMDILANSLDIKEKRHFYRIRNGNDILLPHHIITQQDIDKLYENSGSFPVDLFLVFIYTGLTVKEFLAMDKSWINTNLLEIRTNFKGRFQNRIIPIHPKILPVLENWIINGNPLEQYVSSTNTTYRSWFALKRL